MLISRLFYIALLIAAFIFSQALYDSISLFTLAIVVVIPVISFLFLLISFFLVKVQVGKVVSRVPRLKEFTLPLSIRSRTPLMLPMIKVFFTVSSPEGDRSVSGYSFVQYKAFGTTTIEIPIRFDVRGVYQVGVQKVVFYDFLRLFSLHKKINLNQTVLVEPRRLKTEMPVEVTSQEQETSVVSGGKETRNSGDMAGIREFNEYDTLRQVHWKLSSRLSKMIVKTYWENSCENVMIVADLFSYEEPLVSRHLTDCVVELTLRLTNLMSEEQIRCVLGYPNPESMLYQQAITTVEEQIRAMDDFRMTPMMPGGALEQALTEIDFTALNGGALYLLTTCDAERAEQAIAPYLKGLNCRLHLFVIRPEPEKEQSKNMTVMTLSELEHDLFNQ